MKKTLSFLFILFLISSTAYAMGPMAFPQDLRPTGNPTFSGATIGTITGIVKGTAGVLGQASSSDIQTAIGAGVYAPFTIPEVDGHTDATVLTAANCSGASITSYGRTGAATLTLPAAAGGLNCIFDVGTQHNSAWKIQRAGSDTITKDGNTGKTYFQEVNQVVTSSIACRTTKTGASTYTWVCITGGGTWTTD